MVDAHVLLEAGCLDSAFLLALPRLVSSFSSLCIDHRRLTFCVLHLLCADTCRASSRSWSTSSTRGARWGRLLGSFRCLPSSLFPVLFRPSRRLRFFAPRCSLAPPCPWRLVVYASRWCLRCCRLAWRLPISCAAVPTSSCLTLCSVLRCLCAHVCRVPSSRRFAK